MFFLSFIYYYLGSFRTITIVTYLISIKDLFKKKSLIEMIIIFYLLFIFIFNIYRLELIAASFYLRLFWGFLFFYFYFKNKYIDFNKIIFWFSLLTIIEFILIHIYPNLTDILLNYSTDEGYSNLRDVNGIFTGAHTFGGNRTVAGVLLLSLHLFAIKNNFKHQFISFIAFICTFSTTAFLLYLLYLLIRLPKILSLFLILLIFFILTFLNEVYYRFSYEYISFIFLEYKLNQINLAIELLSNDSINLLFGNIHPKTNSLVINNFGLNFGDFLLLDYTVLYGIFGILFLILFYFNKINKVNNVALIIIFLGTIHYHVLFSFPGQIFAGYFLSRNKTNI